MIIAIDPDVTMPNFIPRHTADIVDDLFRTATSHDDRNLGPGDLPTPPPLSVVATEVTQFGNGSSASDSCFSFVWFDRSLRADLERSTSSYYTSRRLVPRSGRSRPVSAGGRATVSGPHPAIVVEAKPSIPL